MTKQTLYRQKVGLLETALLILLLLFFLTIKFLFLMYANPLPDEAYYWLWSKNADLSYFDHPPLVAWVQSLVLPYSDNNYFVIRVLPFVSLGIVLTIIIAWHYCMLKKPDYGTCLKSLVLFLAFPIFSIFFSISFPDYLLITLLFASSFCLFLYFERNDLGASGIFTWYLAVLFFSLALLSKYNAVLFGVGVLVYILFYKKNLNGPSFRHIIASISIVAFFQTPVIFWNIDNNFASFSFHLNDRLDKEKDFTIVFKNFVGFLLGAVLAFSPIFILNLINKFLFNKNREDWRNFIEVGKFVFVFSAIFCVFLSFFTNVLYYWISPAIVLFIPFFINIIRSKLWQYSHILYGLMISLFLLVNSSIYPISAFFGSVDRETAILFGWEKIVEVIDDEKRERGIEKVVFSDYRLGSLYIFHSGDFATDVVMEERKTQFDIWRGKKSVFMMNALIIADYDFPLGRRISSSFDSISFVRDIDIYIGEKFVKKYKVFLGTSS